MTIGEGLPIDGEANSRPKVAAPRRSYMRASGPVMLGRDARLALASVELSQIRGPHPALRDRDLRLDLAGGSLVDVARWKPEALDVFLYSAPMWCIERGPSSDRHFLVVAGAELLPALHRALPPHTSIPIIVVEAKLKDRGWLEIAAVHAATIASVAAGFTDTYVQTLLSDAQVDGTKRSRNPETRFP